LFSLFCQSGGLFSTYKREVCPTAQFARKQLEEHKYPVEINQFYMAAQKGIKEGYVQNIFHLKPAYIPDFLKDMDNTDQPH